MWGQVEFKTLPMSVQFHLNGAWKSSLWDGRVFRFYRFTLKRLWRPADSSSSSSGRLVIRLTSNDIGLKTPAFTSVLSLPCKLCYCQASSELISSTTRVHCLLFFTGIWPIRVGFFLLMWPRKLIFIPLMMLNRFSFTPVWFNGHSFLSCVGAGIISV